MDGDGARVDGKVADRNGADGKVGACGADRGGAADHVERETIGDATWYTRGGSHFLRFAEPSSAETHDTMDTTPAEALRAADQHAARGRTVRGMGARSGAARPGTGRPGVGRPGVARGVPAPHLSSGPAADASAVVRTTLRVEADAVTWLRHGLVHWSHTFRAGQIFESRMALGHQLLDIRTETESLRVDVRRNGGTLSLAYIMWLSSDPSSPSTRVELAFDWSVR
ncbi:DUF1934 domain-containing protein [Alicyclobacillus acidiphilus]|nr:DUF1934 domain-containing protein [Alicyclobacillus acidiphilus]